jgi:hypothetical protein
MVSASPITAPSTGDSGQVFELQDYRWVQVVVRRVPTLIDCSFEVVTGLPTVRAELVSEDDFRQFYRRQTYEALESTETGHSGHFQRLVDTPGFYRVLIRNSRGAAPVAVSLVVRTEVDPQGDVTSGVTPIRKAVVILASLMVFAGTVTWSGGRLVKAWRNR